MRNFRIVHLGRAERWLASLASFIVLGGCVQPFPPGQDPSARMAMYRADLPNRRRVPMVIDRGELQTRIAKGQLLRAVRLVPLLRGGGTSTIPYPEYRLFGIKEGSVYSLLGLRNTDVLVAADGFIIRDPGVFPAFVELLGTQPTGSIEIMRHDEPILFEYTIE